jgi:hypothetical protein
LPQKVNPQNLHKIHPSKANNKQTTFTTQSTTTKPKNHHIQKRILSKTPSKNTLPPQTKKAIQPKPNRLF